MGPYRNIFNSILPKAKIIDLWASTENACMGLKPPNSPGHYLLIDFFVPEILPIPEMIKLIEDKNYQPKIISLSNWKTGDKEELIITRNGDCLPLLRYRTGDEIEVLKQFEDDENSGPFRFKPLVKLLGRSAEKIDFFDPEQWGPYHGDEIHFSDIDSVLGPIESIKWWELYATHEVPRRLVLVIIPNSNIKNMERIILNNLLDKMNESNKVFEIANVLGELDIIVLPVNAFQCVQKEIDNLSKIRGASRVKPRRLFVKTNCESIYSHLH